MSWLFLFIAIVGEVIGTTALKASNGFSKLIPSIVTVISYSFTFYFLSLALKSIPVGLAYAIWGGVGIILISAIGYFIFKQTMDLPAIIGIILIILGTLIINIFSKSVSH